MITYTALAYRKFATSGIFSGQIQHRAGTLQIFKGGGGLKFHYLFSCKGLNGLKGTRGYFVFGVNSPWKSFPSYFDLD